jgi:hypothetical protein
VLHGLSFQRAYSYLDQLNRVRRFLARLESQNQDDVSQQDFMWAFFQNCWHLKDWIRGDVSVSRDINRAIQSAAHQSWALGICSDLANGTKHFENKTAEHSRMDTRITLGKSSVVDAVIDMGDGTTRSGLEVARQCLLDWEAILTRHNLPIACD